MTVNVQIDISTAKGRKILQALEKEPKYVKIDHPLPTNEDGSPLKTYSVEESFERLWDKMEEHYGYDIRKL